MHVIQALWTREWWLLATVSIAGLIEIIGWSARIASSQTPDSVDDYIMQLSTLIIAPCFFTAMTYCLLGFIIKEQGPKYSVMPPKAFGITFIINDIISIVIQAIGGAMASLALKSDDPNADPDKGAHVMLGGIIYQLLCLVVYTCFFLEFVIRHWLDKPIRRGCPSGTAVDKDHDRERTKRRLSLFMIGATTLLLLYRSGYRVAELSEGWTGRIIRTELYFDVMDGFPVVTCMALSNIFHPGFLKARTTPIRTSQYMRQYY